MSKEYFDLTENNLALNDDLKKEFMQVLNEQHTNMVETSKTNTSMRSRDMNEEMNQSSLYNLGKYHQKIVTMEKVDKVNMMPTSKITQHQRNGSMM